MLAWSAYAQSGQTGNDKRRRDPEDPGNLAYNKTGRVVTCGDPGVANPSPAFEPPCYARVFEDFKSAKRVILYSPHHPYQFSRIMEADLDSTIVIDFSEGLRLNRDLALNNMILRARLVHGDTTTPIQVINYAEIGKDQATQGSQKAFGFQTFEDVSDAILNLFYTTKDIVERITPSKYKCFEAVSSADTAAEIRKKCRIEAPEGDLDSLQQAASDAAAVRSRLTAQKNALQDKLRIAVLEQRLAAEDKSCPNCRQLIDERLEAIKGQMADLDKAIDHAKTGIDAADSVLAKFKEDKKTFTDRDKLFSEALALHEPEVRSILALFLSDANRTVAAHIAHRVFEIDYQSVIAIAKQIQGDFDKLNDPKISAESKIAVRKELLERIYNIVIDLHELREELERVEDVAKNPETRGELKTYCPATLDSPPPFTPRLDPPFRRSAKSFALACVKESELRKFTHEVEPYLVTGTISLRENRAAPGDVITIEIEARGNESETRGAIGKFEIRVRQFGWKPAATDSILFVERRFVTQADQARMIRKVRFRPAPGANLLVDYYARGSRPFKDALDPPLDDLRYRLPAAGAAHTLWRALSPGFGLNTSLLDFDDADGRIQLGVGPIVTLFNNRVSVAYGWNIMARERRQYWGLGFSFIQAGKDVAGFFNKKQN